jgi:hypothetical protein
MNENKMLQEFLKHNLHKPASSIPAPQSKAIHDPGSRATPGLAENSLEYIISKKPSDKKVRKFLQGLIDEIVAENED